MKLMAQLVEVCIILAAVWALAVVVAATIYDIVMALRRRQFAKALHALRHHPLPKITYLISITTSTDGLEQCLDHAQHSYRHHDCVVVVASTAPPAIKQSARAVVVGRPNCRLYVRRMPAPLSAILAAAYRRSQRGEYIVFLRPNQFVAPTPLRWALAWSQILPRFGGIRFTTITQQPVSMATVASLLLQASARLTAKALPFRWSSVLPAGLYRKSAFRQYCTGQRVFTRYHAEVAIESTAYPHLNLLLFFVGLIFWGVALYSCIVAATLLSPWPLVTSWAVICAWLVAAIWFDSTLDMIRKIDLTLTVPFGYFALFGHGIIATMQRISKRTF